MSTVYPVPAGWELEGTGESNTVVALEIDGATWSAAIIDAQGRPGIINLSTRLGLKIVRDSA